jgi:uncharacterized membrane protein YphA (DoxX/SURF4 family)
MKEMFNIAESGTGTYRLLAILRWVMVVIFVSFGMQKFTLQSAQGIEQFITNSPLISWLSVLGLRGEAYFLGVAEFVIAALLVAGAFNPLLSALGSLLGVVTFRYHVVFFLYDTRRREVEPFDRPYGLEFGRRVPVQGYRPAMRVRSAVSRVIAASRDSATYQRFAVGFSSTPFYPPDSTKPPNSAAPQ